MNIAIFRKVSLARLSSPEQLDQLLRVATPKSWMALAASALLTSVAVLWGFEGRLPSTADGMGVLVLTGGVLNVVAQGPGLVVSINAAVGDKVKARQVVARIAQPGLLEKLSAARQALAEAKAEYERQITARQGALKLQLEAIDRQRQNLEREITELEQQAAYAAEQIPVEDDLFAKGLVTKEQTILARQRLTSIRDQIAGRKAQISQAEAQRVAQDVQRGQAESDGRFRISDLERTLAGMQKEFDIATEVVSPYAGEVIELKVYPGGVVAPGSPILSIQPNTDQLEALVYVKALQAKKVRAGMAVQISPTSVQREEFGFMIGRVVSVSNYPATSAALMRNFQNDMLVGAIEKDGPVNEIRVAMEADSAAPSGFKWSSREGPPITVSSGTICVARVVTRLQKPVSMILPLAKEKLGLD
jgi:HlyD family secretion protein